jgi:hypothetical protein
MTVRDCRGTPDQFAQSFEIGGGELLFKVQIQLQTQHASMGQ